METIEISTQNRDGRLVARHTLISHFVGAYISLSFKKQLGNQWGHWKIIPKTRHVLSNGVPRNLISIVHLYLDATFNIQGAAYVFERLSEATVRPVLIISDIFQKPQVGMI